MQVICVVPIYKRPEITKLVISYLKRQTIPFYKIILVGSCPQDEETANRCGVEYIHYSNNKLGVKIQAGIFQARKYNPDMVMVTGSDDLLALNYNALCIEKADGYDALGVKVIWDMTKTKAIYQIRYKTRVDFFGSGVAFTRQYLDRMDWEVYGTIQRIYPDGEMWKILMKARGKTCEVGGVILSPKGSWDMADTWEHIIKANTVYIKEIDTPNKWLDKHFPGMKDEIYEILK